MKNTAAPGAKSTFYIYLLFMQLLLSSCICSDVKESENLTDEGLQKVLRWSLIHDKHQKFSTDTSFVLLRKVTPSQCSITPHTQ